MLLFATVVFLLWFLRSERISNLMLALAEVRALQRHCIFKVHPSDVFSFFFKVSQMGVCDNGLYHVIPCYTMLYHVISCYTMLYHVIIIIMLYISYIPSF